VETFADLYGSFPYSRMLIIEGDFPDGMEFSGLVFVSKTWFTNYDGTPSGYLTLITIHEVAHQWWYARVGNDAALHPWLDEAFSTYSEYIYFEEYYPSLKDWWWPFRVDNYFPEGAVDSTVYEFSTPREYINAVYLRGAKLLHAIREDIGTEAFFDILYRYAEAGDGLLVTPDLFWSLFTPEQLEATRRTRAFYLRDSDIAGDD
jgi:aminopeptidase N